LSRGSARGPRESFAEGRARRGEIDDPAVVLEAALHFLEARQRSVGEVRRRLGSAGYREDLITAAIERLADLGVLDDAAFAQAWIESRDRARPRGERALQAELRQKGIDADTVTQALADRRSNQAEPATDGETGASADERAAERLLARHARALLRVADPRQRQQRAYALLARNGFGPDIAGEAARAFERVADEEPPGGD
jgi:regulatory protein